MPRLPPHKREYTELYRSQYHQLKKLELKVEKTQEEKREILRLLGNLDQLWQRMPQEQKLDIDPLWEVQMKPGGTWERVKPLRCPHCGWVHFISEFSDGPPRCNACFLDVAV